jgi:hypothetical protein
VVSTEHLHDPTIISVARQCGGVDDARPDRVEQAAYGVKAAKTNAPTADVIRAKKTLAMPISDPSVVGSTLIKLRRK